MLRPKLNRVWTSNNANLRRDPGDAKYLQGWIAEIPTFQVLNYLQYKVDTTLLALAERGVFEWGTDVQYGLGSLVWDDATKIIYVATVGAPSRTLRPSQNLGQWAASSIQVSRYDYDDIVSKVSAHIADTTTNPHRITANMIGAYNKAQIDTLVAQYNALVASHANDRNNPHQVTAAQAGAVPVTGGTYTGPVTFQQGMLFDAGGTTKLAFGAQGFYMQSADTRIGIDSSGVPVVGTVSSGVNSRIITDVSFAEVKAREEPNYSVPYPNYFQHLIGDLNINIGSGGFSAPDQWQFKPEFGSALYLPASGSQRIAEQIGTKLGTTGKLTICADVLSDSPRVPGSENASLVIGFTGPSASAEITVQERGYIFAFRSNGVTIDATSALLPAQVNNWYRIAAVFDGDTIKLYFDGVLVSRNTSASVTSAVSVNAARIYQQASVRNIAVRNFRMWDSALTDKQISTL